MLKMGGEKGFADLILFHAREGDAQTGLKSNRMCYN